MAHSHLAREVNIPRLEKVIVHHTVDCTFTYHDRIGMAGIDLVDRLAFFQEWGKEGIQLPHLILGKPDA